MINIDDEFNIALADVDNEEQAQKAIAQKAITELRNNTCSEIFIYADPLGYLKFGDLFVSNLSDKLKSELINVFKEHFQTFSGSSVTTFRTSGEFLRFNAWLGLDLLELLSKSKFSKLTELRLDSCFFGLKDFHSGMSNDPNHHVLCSKRLAKILRDNPHLRVFSLSAPCLNQEGYKIILDSLKYCPNLTELDLTSCEFDMDPTSEKFIQALERMTQLKTLRLNNNNCSSHDRKRILDTLRTKLKITTLNFDESLNKESLLSFQAFLQQTMSLSALSLRGDLTGIDLAEMFGANRSLTYLDILMIYPRSSDLIKKLVEVLIKHPRLNTILVPIDGGLKYEEQRQLLLSLFDLVQKNRRITRVDCHLSLEFMYPFKNMRPCPIKDLEKVLQLQVSCNKLEPILRPHFDFFKSLGFNRNLIDLILQHCSEDDDNLIVESSSNGTYSNLNGSPSSMDLKDQKENGMIANPMSCIKQSGNNAENISENTKQNIDSVLVQPKILTFSEGASIAVSSQMDQKDQVLVIDQISPGSQDITVSTVAKSNQAPVAKM